MRGRDVHSGKEARRRCLDWAAFAHSNGYGRDAYYTIHDRPKRNGARAHSDHTLFDRFLNYLLERNLRIEEDLIDQLFNSSEKQLARTLLLLVGYGKSEKAQLIVPHVSQETLAEMIGTTRSRVNFFMNKFNKLGFIKYGSGLQVNDSLFSVVPARITVWNA